MPGCLFAEPHASQHSTSPISLAVNQHTSSSVPRVPSASPQRHREGFRGADGTGGDSALKLQQEEVYVAVILT